MVGATEKVQTEASEWGQGIFRQQKFRKGVLKEGAFEEGLVG